MESNIKIIKQLNYMVMLTIIIQFLLLLKNSFVASRFGVSEELDAFNISNNIVNFVYSFIGAGISTLIIPYLKNQSNKKSLDIFITIIYTFGIALLIIIIIFNNQIIILISGNNNHPFLKMTSKIVVFIVIAGFLDSAIQLIRAVLEYEGRFNRQKIAIIFTTTILVFWLWINNNLSIYNFVCVLLVTTILNLFFHLFFIRKTNFKYKINVDIRDSGFKEMAKLYIPTVLSTGVYQLSLIIDTSIAARLDVGSISILNYSSSLISMINMLFLGNITSFFYPRLVKQSTEIDRQKSFISYTLFINLIMCLIFILFFIVGKDVISVLFQRGKFTSNNTNTVFICTLIFAISLPINGTRDLIYRYFYIMKDTFSPFVNSLIISLINIIVSVALSFYFGLYGVVIGTVVASYLSLLFISIKFKRKFGIINNNRFLVNENLKIFIAALLTIAISIVFKSLLVIGNIYIEIIIYSLIAIFIYLFFVKIFKSKIFGLSL